MLTISVNQSDSSVTGVQTCALPISDKSIKYLKSLPYKIVRYEEPFNYAKMNNLAAAKANGDYLLFLNDDTKALEPDWLTEM